MRSLLLWLTCLAVLAAGPAEAAEKLRILMIGNSYTQMTHKELREMLLSDGKTEVELVARCPGGRTLAEHAANPETGQLLTSKDGWHAVILQEQSQLPAFAMDGPPDGPMMSQLDAGAPVLIPMIRKAQPQARIILFETWARHPQPDRQKTLERFGGDPGKMQDALDAGFDRMVKSARKWDFSKFVVRAPVGRAFEGWYAAHGYDKPEFKLHQADSSHPAKAGAILTAAVLYECVTGRPATGTAYDGGCPFAGELKSQASQAIASAKDRTGGQGR